MQAFSDMNMCSRSSWNVCCEISESVWITDDKCCSNGRNCPMHERKVVDCLESPVSTDVRKPGNTCLDELTALIWLNFLTLSQTSPGFYVSAVQVFWKHWENELLTTSNFSFSHSVFYPFGELPAIFIKNVIVICKLFHLKESKICHFGKG